MRLHTHLPAMVGFVRKHVAQHFHANRPRPSPAVSEKFLDAAPTAERFREHLRAESGALRQSSTGLPRGAVRAIELLGNLQMRSCQPDPLRADVVHVGEDRRDGAGLTGGFNCPGARVKMLDEHLVHTLIGGKGLDCRSAQLCLKLRVNLVSTGGHGSKTPLALSKKTDCENSRWTQYMQPEQRVPDGTSCSPRGYTKREDRRPSRRQEAID